MVSAESNPRCGARTWCEHRANHQHLRELYRWQVNQTPKALVITHRLIKLGTRTYPLQNIGEVYTDEADIPRQAKFKNVMWMTALLVLSLFLRVPRIR